jgi:hypothetical protein
MSIAIALLGKDHAYLACDGREQILLFNKFRIRTRDGANKVGVLIPGLMAMATTGQVRIIDPLRSLVEDWVRKSTESPESLFDQIRESVSRNLDDFFNGKPGWHPFFKDEIAAALVGWDGLLNSFRACAWGVTSRYKCIDAPAPTRQRPTLFAIGKDFPPEYQRVLATMMAGGMEPTSALTYTIRLLSLSDRDVGGTVSTCTLKAPARVIGKGKFDAEK